MHEKDRRFWVILGIWATIAVGAISTGIGAFISGSPHWGFVLCAIGLVGAIVATLHLLEARRIAPRQSHVSVVMVLVAAVTVAFISWQTWMWLHPPLQPVQGYTKAQLDDAAAKAKEETAKPLQDKLDQAGKDYQILQQSIPKQIADAVAKATAQLPQQAQSDTPVSTDKLPTSLKVLLKGTDFEQIGNQPNILSATAVILYGQRSALLTVQGYPRLAILILFKKPVTYSDAHFENHDSGISPPELTSKTPRYALITFDSILNSGLVDIIFK